MKQEVQKILMTLAGCSMLLGTMPVCAAPEEEGVPIDGTVVAEDGISGEDSITISENEVTDPQQEELKRILSGLSWNNWRIAYQEGVTEQEMVVPYINKAGVVAYGMIKIYFPADTSQAVPLVYVPHYEAGEYSLEAVNYLQHGWAVASPLDLYGTINSTLLEDDLVFNNAALYTLRHLPEIDSQRIALAGNSAGGYTALMLDALQLGNCACVANYAMVNPYDTFTRYFPQVDQWNARSLRKAQPGDTPLFPIAGQVSATFAGIQNNMPANKDYAQWEALSPIGLCCDLSAPVMENHYTSDVLIPASQIVDWTGYAQAGESVPNGFSTALPEKNGSLGQSLAERLPANSTHIGRIAIETPFDEITLTYDPAAFFNINLLDDGPVEAGSGHYTHADYVFKDDSVFLTDMFARTLTNAEVLTADKAVLLLHRYMGVSAQLPVHYGVDETVYGSLSVYRAEITEELARYVQNHSYAELEAVVQLAMQLYPEDILIVQAWTELAPALAVQ